MCVTMVQNQIYGEDRGMDSSKRPHVLHPNRREGPGPSGGVKVAQNPPALLWPVQKGKGVRYSVRLSQDRKFPKRKTLSVDRIRWALFNPHRKLEAGTWFWQYGVSKGTKKIKWSEVFHFQITRSARVRETPSAEEMLAGVSGGHPRLWVGADDLEGLRKRIAGKVELKRFVRRAKRYIGERLPDDTMPLDKGENAYQVRTFKRWESKALAGGISSSIQWLAPAYLMTGDLKLAQEAIRRGLHVSRWDPKGFTARNVSDFADGSCMRIMAQVYDTCYDLLSERERNQLRAAMWVRAQRLYESMVNNLEGRVFSAHIWQHILLEFAEVTFATLHELPEAEEWATYIYELWLARVPLLGGEDGGWANGNNYFNSNIETLLSIPVLFQRTAGVDLFDHPWYGNSIDFLMYTWPPGSVSDGFGDGAEKLGGPQSSRVAFVSMLGQHFQNPYAMWYRNQTVGNTPFRSSPMMEWLAIRLGEGRWVQAKAPRDLPSAKAFRDVGVVSMHTSLADSAQNLNVAFRSSPFGSTNHMHASQNSFNLMYGGVRLFQSSGYYIAYGDEHFNGWYKHSKGHNTVLMDGKGQAFGAEGYGLIARFLDGKRISYCLGDASQAYGDAGLTRFRRHLVLLKPGTVVVYDDLEADHPARWSWLLHSARKMTKNGKLQRLQVKTRTAKGQADLLGSSILTVAVDDQFDPPALNWRKKAWNGKIPDEYPKQWHATVSPEGPADKFRYLAIIQVHPVSGEVTFETPAVTETGAVQVGDWHIEAALDVSRPASLVVRHRDGKSVLAVDRTRVVAGKQAYGAKASSVLIEALRAKRVVQRSRDEWPRIE